MRGPSARRVGLDGPVPFAHAVRMTTAVLLNHDHMGHGDRELGVRILKTFLQKARGLKDLEEILLVNSGVRLLSADSPVITELHLLQEHGVDVIACGTCVEHFGIDLAEGHAGSMDGIVAAMQAADKVITL